MYKIVRKDKKVPVALKNKAYQSYEKARSNIRSWIIKQIEKGRYQRTDNDLRNRTITIGNYGFSVTSI